MSFLMNIWYVAAWSHEVGDTLLARTLLDQPMVLFRGSDGSARALDDLCPHRFAPLSLGRLVGGNVQCGYHGLEFDGSGALVGNPHGTTMPKACRVRSYPIVERYGVIWIWPGAPEDANPETIPDFSYLVEPDRKTVHGGTLVEANYELISDNLMDASHTQYVHLDLLGTSAFANSKHEVLQEGNIVHSNYVVPHSKVLTAYRDYFDPSVDDIEYSVRFQWQAPGLVTNRVSLVPYDDAHPAIYRTGTHLMTPETETTTHYFFAHTRNFLIDDPEVDERTRRWQKLGLTDQDGPMIEACQARMGKRTDLMAMGPALFPFDEAAVRVRRVMSSLAA
jgi:phenylpropionate dioxygenase-like ring-hydroxylating dioxygenase large terminal subunit